MYENMDLVSIIVPVYNRESDLKNCIESILNQTYKNIQLILVDDGSTDNSLYVCRNYADKDSRIIVHHQNNSGPAAARNAGLDIAKGKYIMFVDSDDCIHQNCIEIMCDSIKQFDVRVAMCGYGERRQVFAQCPKTQAILTNSKTILQKGLNEKEKTLYCWAKLWSKEVIRDVRFKPLSFCEDALFSIEALLNCQTPISYVTGVPLYYYLRKNDSITNNLSNKNLADSLEVAENILKMTENTSDDIRKPAINYCISAAFFSYLQVQNDSNSNVVRIRALKIIQKYKRTALCNLSSSLKVKIACMISFFSMGAVTMAYRLIKG